MRNYPTLCAMLCSLACSGAPAPDPTTAANPASGERIPVDDPPHEAASVPTAQAAVTGSSTPATATAAAAPKRERIRLHNSCSKPVPLRIERDHDSDTDTTLGSNTSTEERATDGDEIRLLDDHRSVLAALKIETATQEINVASDCKKLEAK